ncbi:MAG: hypothetical protein NTW50_03880 [Candidatus Berkelbacteria bacterium]|nr:hypothetical protein [Candidatus Berkelbacteria bacterium]
MKKAKEEWEKCCPPKYWHHGNRGGMSGGGMYCLGVIGTAVYYIQQVSGFGPSIVAILKAIVWPAFLLYKFFTMLHM